MHNADPSTWTISNNVFVGTASAPPAGAIARNNIVYANANASPGNPGSGYEEDAVGDNQGNLVYYKGQPYPQEPAPFDESRNFFVGGDDFSQAFVLHHGRNFNAAFRPADDSPARDFGAPECAPPVDMADVSRDNRPDAGAYEIVATGGNRRPVLAAVGNKSTSADTLLTFDLSATDADGDSLTYSAGTLPAGARLSGRTFTWKPTARQTGSYQVTFRVSDGQAQDSETITITVERSNARPILSTIGNKTIDENQVLTFSVSASDADRDPITYSAAGLPNGATFTGRTFTWTPGYDQAGTYNVTFAAGDGRAQDSQTIAISVANVNRPPVLARIGDRSAYESSPLAFALLAADPDGAGLTYSATGLPDGARLTGQNFSWTPNAGQIGSYEVTFLVNDGTLTDSETITITVAGAASDRTAPAVARQSPAPDTIQVPLNNLVTLYVTDAGRGVDPRSIQITVDGKLVYQGDTPLHTSAYGRCSRSGTANSYQFIYQPNQMFDFDHRVAVTVNASDLAGNVMNEHAYSFATEMRAFGNVKRASRMTMAGKEHPATVSDDQGNIWVAWHAGREGARDVYVALLPAARELFQTEMRITTDSRDQCNPELALGSDGSVYVVWQDDRRGHWDIYAAVCSDGRTFSQNLLVTDLEGNQTKPTAAVVPGSPDRVYVAWQDDRNGNQDICVGSSTNALATVTVAQVTTNAADQTEPDIAADGSNAVYLVWTDGRNGHADIYGAAPANAWANVPIVTDADDQTRPAIAIAPGGTTMHLVWMDNHAGDTDIYYASSTGLPASPLAGVNTVDDTSGANQTAPALACAGNGKVFACWEDMRNVGVYGRDVDVYFVELSSEAVKTNILVGDTGARANQGQPVVAVSAHDQPYMVWTDDRTRAKEIHCAGTTLIDPTPLHAVVVATATGATVGTDPAAITTPEDVSLVVPAGAAPDNVRITISKIHNPVVSPADCLGSYDFGPSGISFEQPVTVTIPYRLDQANRNARAYWYNPLTGAMSQQGISRIENIRISGNLYALRFKTTHFTPFYLLADGAEAASSGGGGGGCSISVTGDESPGHLLVPCGLVAVVMAILRHRDRKRAIHDIGQ
jgi:hypothetical protein